MEIGHTAAETSQVFNTYREKLEGTKIVVPPQSQQKVRWDRIIQNLTNLLQNLDTLHVIKFLIPYYSEVIINPEHSVIEDSVVFTSSP